VQALGGDVTPLSVLRADELLLRGAGLSAAKLRAIRDLAEKVSSGEVPVDDLERLPDDEVVERLTRVRGIGVWTAQMYLMFRLRRPDVWPTGDLGVRAGFARMHGLDAYPTAKELHALGEPYRPWRSAVAWYCYRALETEMP
jgi:3-methyladenine DNA glycosylase/8-oxoguanine DNA glycosylase